MLLNVHGGFEMSGGAVLGRYVTPKEIKDQLKRKHELSSKEAAAYLDMSVRTLYNLISSGEGPRRIQTGSRGALKFMVPDLDAYKRQRENKKEAFRK